MKVNKEDRISIKCTKEEKDKIISESNRLHMNMSNYIINCVKSCESNKRTRVVDPKEVAELAIFIKSLEYKYKIESEDSNNLSRRLFKLCQN